MEFDHRDSSKEAGGKPPVVLVYRNQLLPFSETFVRNQMEGLRSFRAFYLGGRAFRGPYLDLPADRTYYVNRGGIRGRLEEAAFKVGGRIPCHVLEWVHKHNPRLIHAHFAPDGFVALSLARHLRIPLVVSFLGTDILADNRWVFRHGGWTHRMAVLFSKRLRQGASRFVVPSKFLWEAATKRGFPEEKLRLVRHGISLKTFRPDPKIQPEQGHVLFVGRLIPFKGLPYLIRALSLLKKRGKSVHLTVVGDGPQRALYEEMAHRMLGTVRFMGVQPPEKVRELMQRAWVFSMPSIVLPSGRTESFGLVYVEAQALGVPVVAFRIGGVPEVVAHGRTGFLAEEGDVEALAHYLERILDNPGLRHTLGQAGRRWVEENFDVERTILDLEAVYWEVLHQNR